jgi:uncharacterized protein YkwD
VATATVLAADWPETVFQAVQQGRRDAGAAQVRRRADLDAAARERAETIAALPHAERLTLEESVEVGLRRGGVRHFRRARLHVDMARGYVDPGAGFVRSWRRYEPAWATAMDPAWDSAGIASARGDDDWVIFVAVFLEEIAVPTDLRELERRALEAVNGIRRERGLSALAPNEGLAEVARRHSEEMARLGYFSHHSPSGTEPADRAERHGISFRTLAENIQTNQGHDDPVSIAVEGWMNSKGHRKNILDSRFTLTGVGVAIDEDGAAYFTQLFMTPP